MRSTSTFCFALALAACLAGKAEAQIYTRPVVSPPPPPTVVYYPVQGSGGNLLQPVYTPVTQYNFNGPSSGTVGWTTTNVTSYYQDPYCRTRTQTTTQYTPVFGYQPGYYSGYYTPLYFRP